jgi:superfamily II DNA or RNA helicase
VNWKEMRLLHDAMLMRLRAGAGPFRSFGNISVEPRAYQLVPLMMALRQETVRLLIADDVGVGKTIEAGLIVRELMDRGDVARLSILCPPTLAEQWQSELKQHFNLNSVILTASSIRSLERQVPPGESIFQHFPVTIISLDYIKSQQHRQAFLSHAPELIVVDEAHTCTSVGRGVQQRYSLLRSLADEPTRHLILLTATPHSGIEKGFYDLLGLLDQRFADMESDPKRYQSLRTQLAQHFVQRKRADIEQWAYEDRMFPTRESSEVSYSFTGPWGSFFDDVQEYCLNIAKQQSKNSSNRLIWYAALALLRCISSSPASAISAMQTRLEGITGDNTEAHILNALSDDDEEFASDLEDPALGDQEKELAILNKLMARAKKLKGQENDPKLSALISSLKPLLKAGYSPIIFCQYISTAEYLAEELSQVFKSYAIKAVTGGLAPNEREEAVADLCDAPQRILVATACLSEGINLQDGFDAVIHYDLAWNPTRHEQREGRVDRYGQKSPTVRCMMIYGSDNPVDGFIMDVILRKAKRISDQLGVRVPIPEDQSIKEAMVQAALLKRRESRSQAEQLMLFDTKPFETNVEQLWKEAAKKAQRTIFAQRPLKPEEVIPEFNKQKALLGTKDDLQRFLLSACDYLGAPLDGGSPIYTLNTDNLRDPSLKRRLQETGFAGTVRFSLDSGTGVLQVTRAHPLVAVLSEFIAEQSLSGHGLSRASVMMVSSSQCNAKLTVYGTRLRHSLKLPHGHSALMAEELLFFVRRGKGSLELMSAEFRDQLSQFVPTGDIQDQAAQRQVADALCYWNEAGSEWTALAQQRAVDLQDDHNRVREAAHQKSGKVEATPLLPLDLLSVLVIIPTL